jgi:tRNA(Ile)-lysidine synthetase-like protein
MQLGVKDGKYVVAVSGGVDSVVLLDLLTKNKSKLDLIVAHFDHGIRTDSIKDRILVENLAAKYDLPFYFAEGKLGSDTSEENARVFRYSFLKTVVKDNKADGLITAHHQDDQIETAIINIIRGTGRRGLSSIINSKVLRPLLGTSKKYIIAYALKNKLVWNEDSTNSDPKYLRNYIRLSVMPKLKSSDRKKIIEIIDKQAKLNQKIDKGLDGVLNAYFINNELPRMWFNSLDNKSANEILAYWLRINNLTDYDQQTINRLAVSIKTAGTNKKIDVFSGHSIEVKKDFLALTSLER